MPDHWQVVCLGDLAEVFDGPHATPTKTADGPWYLSISSLQGGKVELSESAHLSDDDFITWTRRVQPEPGDTLFSYETRLGEAGHWSLDVPAALGRRMGLLRPRREKVDPRFLTYVYMGLQFQSEIARRAIRGATVDRVPIAEIGQWPIGVPTLEEQRRIAGVLSALDDLIDTNRALVRDLWSAAEAAFADASARAEVVPAGECIELRYGKPLPAPSRRPGPVAVVSSAGVVASHDEALVGAPGVVVGRKGSVGTVTWVDRDFFPIDTAFYVASTIPLAYCYFALRSMGLEHMNTDSAVPGLNRDNALSRPFPRPTEQALDRFVAVTAPLLAAAKALEEEAEELVRTHDELLPLLLSGRIRVNAHSSHSPGRRNGSLSSSMS